MKKFNLQDRTNDGGSLLEHILWQDHATGYPWATCLCGIKLWPMGVVDLATRAAVLTQLQNPGGNAAAVHLCTTCLPLNSQSSFASGDSNQQKGKVGSGGSIQHLCSGAMLSHHLLPEVVHLADEKPHAIIN